MSKEQQKNERGVPGTPLEFVQGSSVVRQENPPPLDYTTDKDYALRSKKMDLDAGLLGKVFGTSSNAPTNIAGILVVSFSLVMIYAAVWQTTNVGEISKFAIPVITLALGYLFGKKS